MAKHEIIFGQRGDARAVYSPVTDGILRGLGGEFSTRRASNVEPTEELSDSAVCWLWQHGFHVALGEPCTDEGVAAAVAMSPDAIVAATVRPQLPRKWWADMRPLNPDGPVLGPYDDRDTALAEEVKYLKEHNIPVCLDCSKQ